MGTVHGSVLHGSVLGGDGSPLAGAAITLIDPSGRQLGRTVAHADGRYAVRAPGMGSYLLIAAVPGHQPTAVSVTVGHHSVALDLRLAGIGGMSGPVPSKPDGTPVPQATVVATDARGKVASAAATDASGECPQGRGG
jgi:hypothetical protein